MEKEPSNNNQYNEANGYLNLFNHQNIQTIGDGKCWLRTLSLYFDGIEDNYQDYRQKVYEHAKKFKEDLRPYFIQENNNINFNNNDDLLENYIFYEYIENIAYNHFYSGNIEKLLSS